jgi:hypothetical protein
VECDVVPMTVAICCLVGLGNMTRVLYMIVAQMLIPSNGLARHVFCNQ